MDSGAKEDEELARFNEWVSSERGKAVVRGNIATLRMSAERDIQEITRYYESIRRDTPLRMEEFTRRVTTDDDDSYKKTIEAAVGVNERKAAFQKVNTDGRNAVILSYSDLFTEFVGLLQGFATNSQRITATGDPDLPAVNTSLQAYYAGLMNLNGRMKTLKDKFDEEVRVNQPKVTSAKNNGRAQSMIAKIPEAAILGEAKGHVAVANFVMRIISALLREITRLLIEDAPALVTAPAVVNDITTGPQVGGGEGEAKEGEGTSDAKQDAGSGTGPIAPTDVAQEMQQLIAAARSLKISKRSGKQTRNPLDETYADRFRITDPSTSRVSAEKVVKNAEEKVTADGVTLGERVDQQEFSDRSFTRVPIGVDDLATVLRRVTLTNKTDAGVIENAGKVIDASRNQVFATAYAPIFDDEGKLSYAFRSYVLPPAPRTASQAYQIGANVTPDSENRWDPARIGFFNKCIGDAFRIYEILFLKGKEQDLTFVPYESNIDPRRKLHITVPVLKSQKRTLANKVAGPAINPFSVLAHEQRTRDFRTVEFAYTARSAKPGKEITVLFSLGSRNHIRRAFKSFSRYMKQKKAVLESDAPYVDVLALSKMTGAEMAFELPHFFHVVFTLGVGITHGAITREGNFELTYEGQLDQMYQTAKDVSEFFTMDTARHNAGVIGAGTNKIRILEEGKTLGDAFEIRKGRLSLGKGLKGKPSADELWYPAILESNGTYTCGGDGKGVGFDSRGRGKHGNFKVKELKRKPRCKTFGEQMQGMDAGTQAVFRATMVAAGMSEKNCMKNQEGKPIMVPQPSVYVCRSSSSNPGAKVLATLNSAQSAKLTPTEKKHAELNSGLFKVLAGDVNVRSIKPAERQAIQIASADLLARKARGKETASLSGLHDASRTKADANDIMDAVDASISSGTGTSGGSKAGIAGLPQRNASRASGSVVLGEGGRAGAGGPGGPQTTGGAPMTGGAPTTGGAPMTGGAPTTGGAPMTGAGTGAGGSGNASMETGADGPGAQANDLMSMTFGSGGGQRRRRRHMQKAFHVGGHAMSAGWGDVV
jgi:hypothetical protein